METTSYGAFSQTLHHQVRAANAPLNGAIEVTRRCPLTCVHCYNNLPMGDRQAQLQELTLDEHRRILDEMAEAGSLWLLYTGGEIFARPDFLKIYTHAKKNGFIITLFTNGILINEAVADYLAEYRPFAVEITLYGATRETYERLTGIPGSYDRCLRGIDLIIDRGLSVTVKTVAITINRHEVGAMRQMAEQRGVEFRFDSMMNPRIDCSQSPLAVRLTPEQCVEFDLVDQERADEWRKFARQHGAAAPAAQSDQLYQCGGGVDSFAISPYGEMSICVLSHNDRYDLRKGSFADGWSTFLRRLRDTKKVSRVTKCTDCQIRPLCGMCPANGELENGDPESPVDFLCQVTHLRAHAFGLPVAPHGDCEYCEGGRGYDELMQAVSRLKTVTPVTAATSNRAFLPMATKTTETIGACGSGGCASCGGH